MSVRVFSPPSSVLLHESQILANIEQDEDELAAVKAERRRLWRLRGSFFLFGLINNVLYVIILSAALDLVPPTTPKGLIAFCNIAPSLVAKIGWPYLLKGKIRYARRIAGCCILSVLGMLVVASFESVPMRLLGIGFASFSSGLGELTFLQLSTTYPPSVSGECVGYFASGTGAAGLVGAALWWEVRSLGVRIGVGVSSIMPLITPLAYLFLLPSSESFVFSDVSPQFIRSLPYTPLAAAVDEEGEEEGAFSYGPRKNVSLSLSDKWKIVRPLLPKYMLPLFCVYTFEYTINQGIAPTLIYPVPLETQPILHKIIHSLRDYYPLWQLVYQTTVFLSRSSISFGLPPLPASVLSLPAIVQAGILLTLIYESAYGLFPQTMVIPIIFLLISIEGICGGLAYVNVFYRVNLDSPDQESAHDLERTRQEKEFKIGSIGFADATGILLASLIAMPTEISLCNAQVARGRLLCKQL